MIKILHRVNDPQILKRVSKNYGVEMDLHAWGSELTVNHDAFSKGFSFEKWLDEYNHLIAIFNIKEEGIETKALDLIKERGIESFFFLDLSFPNLFKMINKGESRVAIRVSEYESAISALKLSKKAQWIWIDIFNNFPLLKEEYDNLSNVGYKFCLVSPELHGREIKEIEFIKSYLNANNMKIDAVCTKLPEAWD